MNLEAEANAHEIIPRLWLGNVKASMDEDFIRQKNIGVVFNCTKNLPFSPIIPIKYRVNNNFSHYTIIIQMENNSVF